MTVRGTTHARIQKKVFNFDAWDPRKIMCAWNPCDNDGYELYKVVTHQGNLKGERTMNYIFCSEKCKQAWLDELTRNRRRSDR